VLLAGRPVEERVEELCNAMLKMQLVIACDRFYKKPHPGRKHLVKFPRKLDARKHRGGQAWDPGEPTSLEGLVHSHRTTATLQPLDQPLDSQPDSRHVTGLHAVEFATNWDPAPYQRCAWCRGVLLLAGGPSDVSMADCSVHVDGGSCHVLVPLPTCSLQAAAGSRVLLSGASGCHFCVGRNSHRALHLCIHSHRCRTPFAMHGRNFLVTHSHRFMLALLSRDGIDLRVIPGITI
jgi:hypothetical protein